MPKKVPTPQKNVFYMCTKIHIICVLKYITNFDTHPPPKNRLYFITRVLKYIFPKCCRHPPLKQYSRTSLLRPTASYDPQKYPRSFSFINSIDSLPLLRPPALLPPASYRHFFGSLLKKKTLNYGQIQLDC